MPGGSRYLLGEGTFLETCELKFVISLFLGVMLSDKSSAPGSRIWQIALHPLFGTWAEFMQNVLCLTRLIKYGDLPSQSLEDSDIIHIIPRHSMGLPSISWGGKSGVWLGRQSYGSPMEYVGYIIYSIIYSSITVNKQHISSSDPWPVHPLPSSPKQLI